MSQQDIKSAQQVVSDFLQSLTEKPKLDSKTVTAINNLHTEGKLTNIRLLRSLDEIRQETIASNRPGQNQGTDSDE